MQIAVSALGRDRPGIVAAVSGVLAAHDCNLADSQMGILSGRFSLVLIADAPEELDEDALLEDLEGVGRELGLDTIDVTGIEPGAADTPPPTHIVTVYGVDHGGIVHAVTQALAELGANVTDVNTRRVADTGAEPLYMMMLEVAPPAMTSVRSLRDALATVASEQGVDVSVRELDDEPL